MVIINIKHRWNKKSASPVPIATPSLSIALRHRDDFQAGNFSRFVPIWLILLGFLEFYHTLFIFN